MMCNRKYLAVIQAGGSGKRMSSLTKGLIPKPMLKIAGKSMIENQMDMLAVDGISEFVIIIGYQGEIIERFFGDGSVFGYKIMYIKEHTPLGSAGSLFFLKDILRSGEYTDVIFLFADVMFSIDINRMKKFHESTDAYITLLSHPNSHPFDSDLLVVDSDFRVTGIDHKDTKRDYYYKNIVNAGIYMFKSEVVYSLNDASCRDMEKNIITPSITSGKKVFAYITPEFVKDAGTPERFQNVSKQWEEGIQKIKCLKQQQKCIFIDRDGTVNEYKGYITNEKDFVLISGVIDAIKKINSSGYLVILVTNQPVVARGMCDISDVEKIHMKLETLLGESGAYLDDIVFCPHHPDRGYDGENLLYKKECTCRKPKTGMIENMVRRYNIDTNLSYMVGDTTVDIKTGMNAGVKTVLLESGEAGMDGKFNVRPNIYARDLQDAVDIILGK